MRLQACRAFETFPPNIESFAAEEDERNQSGINLSILSPIPRSTEGFSNKPSISLANGIRSSSIIFLFENALKRIAAQPVQLFSQEVYRILIRRGRLRSAHSRLCAVLFHPDSLAQKSAASRSAGIELAV